MNCPNCQTYNIEGSKFCVKCGYNLMGGVINNDVPSNINNEKIIDFQTEQSSTNVNLNSNIQEKMPVNQGTIVNNPMGQDSFANTVVQPNISPSPIDKGVVNNYSINNVSNVNFGFKDYLIMFVGLIIKPFSVLKDKVSKINFFKQAFIFPLIVSVFATILSIITSILNVVKVRQYNMSTFQMETTWVWENIENLDLLELIKGNILLYLVIIFSLSCIYYLTVLIIKKQSNFSRILTVISLSFIPLLVGISILSPLASLIFEPLSILVIIVSIFYFLLILYEGINMEAKIEGNAKFYFNILCLVLIIIAFVIILLIMVDSSSLGEIEDLLEFFG